MTLIGAAGGGTYEEFTELYDPTHANDSTSLGSSILMEAVGNTEPGARIQIANRLLDDGADATRSRKGINCLHILLRAARHDFAPEAQLLRRLLDGGADLNAVAPKFGTPLQAMMGNFSFTDDDYAPFYDVIFSRNDLDLLKVGAYNKSAYELARSGKRRSQLLQRMENYLRDHDIDIPPKES